MKKFYALALAAFALTASAEGIQGGFNLNPLKVMPSKIVRHEVPVRAASTVKPTAAPTIAEVEGLYVWEGYEYLLSNSTQKEIGEFSAPLKISVIDGNNLALTFDYGTYEGTFDPATGNISMESGQISQILWDGELIDIQLDHVVFSDEGFYYAETPLVLEYINGEFETGIDDAIMITMVEDGEIVGYLHIAGENFFHKFTEEIPEGWTAMGTFEYQDSWAFDLFGVDPAEYKYYVTVVKSDEDESVIRILNPYTSAVSMIASLGLNDNTKSGGVIELNIGNPNFIWLTGGLNSGYTFEQAGLVDMTCWNLEGYLKYNNPTATDEALMEAFESNDMEISDMVDDIITVRNCVFGAEGNEYSTGYWENKQGENVMTDAILWLGESTSGINNVVADNENNINAPVVYYNLQGVQVANPQGGIFIRKQGNQTSKVILK
ncbi:MAG: hypothetical protein HDT06_05775 [Bacteroidales bacterium]|nr:hypothetical protein [Bacteroidales bacterium]